MEKIKIAYIGSSKQLILLLLAHPCLKLTAVITQKGRLPDEAFVIFQKLRIKSKIITVKPDLNSISEWLETQNVLMHGFGLILPRELTQSHCICNIHPGSLKNNRGPQPVIRSILNGETSTCLSLHKIDHRVDMGSLIATYEVPIYGADDTLSLEQRLFEGMPYMLDEYAAFLNGRRQGEIISDGVYYPKVEQKDYTIDTDNDTMEIIDRKIRSQKARRGAILETTGYRFYVTSVEKIIPRSKGRGEWNSSQTR
jgi:methionyl-tRNA formyltransferase